MSDLSARLDLPLIKPSQAQKHVTHNEALQVLDGLVQAALEETGAQTPPFEPVEGELYALGTSPSDDWAGQAGKLALRVNGAWMFIAPQEGWRAWDKAAGQFKVYDGAAWAQIVHDLNNLDGVGVGTAFDVVNRLAVASEASLFSHDGAGHQLKVNKAAAGDTASLLFQSGWTGHAEMGLAGDTAFSVKVSEDGATWYDALKADAGAQEIAIDFQVVGNAVQTSPNDTTAGRLLPVGAFGLGAVAPPDAGGDFQNVSLSRFLGGSSNNDVNGPPGAANQYMAVATSANANNQMIFGYFRGTNAFCGIAKAAGNWDVRWSIFYTTENIVGTVSEDGSGNVTGAVIERGSNANGEYVRLADGTQICWAKVAVDVTDGTLQTWPTPASFASGNLIATSVGHVGNGPNAALAFSNFDAVYTSTGVTNSFALNLGTPGTSSDPASDDEKLMLMATGRWF